MLPVTASPARTGGISDHGYTVELGGQVFTQAQWEAVRTYVEGTDAGVMTDAATWSPVTAPGPAPDRDRETATLREQVIEAMSWAETFDDGRIGYEKAAELLDRYAAEHAADEIERLADERAWVTEHDNEVVSVRDLYEQVARLRGELEPVTYDFPPDEEPAR